MLEPKTDCHDKGIAYDEKEILPLHNTNNYAKFPDCNFCRKPAAGAADQFCKR